MAILSYIYFKEAVISTFTIIKPVSPMAQRLNRRFYLQAVLTFLILGFGSSPLFAEPGADIDPASTNSGSWILSAGGAVDFPHSNWSPAYRVGIGSRAEIGFPLGADWAAGLGLGYFHYQGNDASGAILIDEIRVLPMVRLYLANGNVNPYLTGGAGLAVQFAAASGTITGTLNPDGFLGAGLEIRLANREAIFIESNYSLMLAYGTVAEDVEAVAGLRSGF